MLKHAESTILPLSIKAPKSEMQTATGFYTDSKPKQASACSKIVKQSHNKQKQKQTCKENKTSISMKTIEQSLQRPVLIKKQNKPDQSPIHKSRDKSVNAKDKTPKTQTIKPVPVPYQCCPSTKNKNQLHKIQNLNNSSSAGKIKMVNKLNHSTQINTYRQNAKNKKNVCTPLPKSEKIEKFIKKANKNIHKYHQKEQKIEQKPVINIQIQFEEKTNRKSEERQKIRNNSIINRLQQPTNLLESSRNSPTHYKYQSDKYQYTQSLIKRHKSQNKIKRYHYLSEVPSQNQLVDKNIKLSKENSSIRQQSAQRSKNNYENFRIKRSLQNSFQVADKLTLNASLSKNKEQLEMLKYHYYHSPNVAHKPNSHASFLRSHSKSQSKPKDNSLRNILGYLDDVERVRRVKERSINSRSRSSLREHQIEMEVKKLGNRCKKMLNSLEQSPKYRQKYNYLSQEQEQKNRKNIREKQRELLEREMKLKQKQKSIERKDRLQRQMAKQRQWQIQRQRQRQFQKLLSREKQLQKQRQRQRKLQLERRERQKQLQKATEKQVQTKRYYNKFNYQTTEYKSHQQNRRQNFLQVNIHSPVRKQQIGHYHSYKHLGDNCRDIKVYPISHQPLPDHQTNNLKIEEKRNSYYPIHHQPSLQEFEHVSTYTINQDSTRFTTPYRTVRDFRVDHPTAQSPIDNLLSQNYGSNKPKPKQKQQTCKCKQECECVDYTSQLNTSRLHRINNKLEQYIAKNIKHEEAIKKGKTNIRHHAQHY